MDSGLAALGYVPPVDYSRSIPDEHDQERRTRLTRRKEGNLRLLQRELPLLEWEAVASDLAGLCQIG
jgi:hypothetical protein